ncbi:MAG TPA: HAMP domain-containing sensor histidine kinase [Longimicrobiales bacterium]|nr:HAMP domain-containing sensor histidine kinase [Longimicrobiales bacterium]
MRLTSRIAFYLTLLAACLIGTTAYQLRLMAQVHALNRELAAPKMEAARISVRLLQGVEGVREFAAKSLWLRDRDYLDQWQTWEQAFSADLASLSEVPLSETEDAHRIALSQAWARYRSVFGPIRESLIEGLPLAAGAMGASPAADSTMVMLDLLDQNLEPLRGAIETLIVANDASIARLADESVATVDRARRIAWIAGTGSLLLAITLSLGLFLFLSRRLRRLNRGTREIARGNFSHRIDVSHDRTRDELTDLAVDFNDMAQRLGELEEMKKGFISHVSHELKAPLASIHETILILLEQIPGPLTDKQRHLLELSYDSANRLSAMIYNVLEASRLDAGAMQYRFEMHDAVAVTRDVIGELYPLSRKNDIDVSLTHDGATELSCDVERLREVVANLVGNAFKFAPASSRVEIEWRAVPAAPDRAPKWKPPAFARPPHLLLAVMDRGPGVPDADKESIFDRFSQLRGHTRSHGQGVGLGLSIARKIVEAHGGVIWVEDREGGGSRFCALFPGGSRTTGDSTAEGGATSNAPPDRSGRFRATTRWFRRRQNAPASAG